ncbi:ATP-dependent DNA helicase RecG [Candidatus Peregrinibacteria bacterium]|nr:ATP-dependent DNA helicase RecG [Candidatus Peregrinibacteria bacterium]
MNLGTPLDEAIRTKSDYFKFLKEMGILTIQDLLFYFPRAYEDLSHFKRVAEVKDGEVVTLQGVLKTLRNERTRTRKTITRGLFCDDGGSAIACVWFNQPHLIRMVPVNAEVVVSGKVARSYGSTGAVRSYGSMGGDLTLQNPEVELKKEAQIHTGRLVPVYPQHERITSKWLRTKIHPLLYLTKDLPEILPDFIREREKLMSRSEAVREIHFPTSEGSQTFASLQLKKAKDRLAYDELFLLQLRAVMAKRAWQQSGLAVKTTRTIPLDVELVKRFFKSLPFTPTGAQKVAIYEILKDMGKPFPMMRLLEGDVGSGKTIVAFMAMLAAVSAGFQVVLMAPTEVLARQHFGTIQRLLDGFGAGLGMDKACLVPTIPAPALLIGSMKTAEKHAVMNGLKDGTIFIVVGTHALIQEDVQFRQLGLAVIDEQHRFGVKQRDMLIAHGGPHVLNMTATPIPRTLAMVAYGDQDLSVLNEMPSGRQTIITKVVPPEHVGTVHRFVADKIRKKEQVFVICPLIDESDVLEVKSVKREFEHLQKEVFPEFRVSMLHGKLKSSEKEAVMQSFVEGTTDILVSTSVIEVGIDVPNATMMLIEGADRFGLSQLHQFRGRVGRGKQQSYCFLYTQSNSAAAFARLKAMTEFSDGFRLAEMDLKLRGPGEVYGVRQSGIPDFKLATLSDGVLVARIRKTAEELLDEDLYLDRYPMLKKAIQA